MRERLITLIDRADEECKHTKDCKICSGYNKGSQCMNYHIADYLIANGVVVSPCKVGTRHNNLTFIAVDDVKTREKGRPYYILRCDCGNIKSVRKDLWESGSTKACGCLYETHGQAKGQHTRIYNIFHGMKKRCYNANSKSYKYYGGRGIKICDEWLNDFEAFLRWSMDNGYQENLTIDRINVNGDYCPNNCRWITMAEQQRNKRNYTKKDAERALRKDESK